MKNPRLVEHRLSAVRAGPGKWSKRFAAFLVVGLFSLSLAACGSGESPVAPTGSAGEDDTVQAAPRHGASIDIAVSLRSNETEETEPGSAEKTGIGPLNIIDLEAEPWLTWTGADSGVTFVSSPQDGVYSPDGLLRIPAPGDGQDLTVAVRRFERPLREGYQYSLSVQSETESATAILFLFDASGQLVAVPGASGLAMASAGSGSLSFIAPAGVAGFYLQVQSAWQATNAALIRPYMPAESVGGTLIDVTRPWTDWAGNAEPDVNYNGLTGFNFIGPPADGQTLRYGVQRYDIGLEQGRTYDLAIRGTTGASILLFMFDQDGQLIADGATSWLAATATMTDNGAGCINNDSCVFDTTRFEAPAGVSSFAIQLQGPYQASAASFVYIKLEAAE